VTRAAPIRAGYLAVSGLGCPECAEEVRQALLRAEGVAVAAVFADEGVAAVGYDPMLTRRAEVALMVQAAAISKGRGYRVGWMGSRRLRGGRDGRF
jgi:copper chaperone CopZ